MSGFEMCRGRTPSILNPSGLLRDSSLDKKTEPRILESGDPDIQTIEEGIKGPDDRGPFSRDTLQR